ncbi:MAG: hypothetical protein JNK35_03965 [Phycisphaerae bacterium]|nr:hypothetical protein [Phycisphaerae bacterium]
MVFAPGCRAAARGTAGHRSGQADRLGVVRLIRAVLADRDAGKGFGLGE